MIANAVTTRNLRRWVPLLSGSVLLFAFALLLFGQFKEAHAATRTVCAAPTGDYTTIQAAVNDAVAGDVIQICAGVYDENVDLGTMAELGDLALVGVGDVTVTNSSYAFYLGIPFPGRLSFTNIAANSTGSDSILLSSNITGGLVITGSDLSGGAGRGLSVSGIEGPVYITNTTVSGNSSDGIMIFSELPPSLCGTPDVVLPDAVRLSNLAVALNDGSGVVVTSDSGSIVVEDSTSVDNDTHGFELTNYDSCFGSQIVIRRSTANSNGQESFGSGSGFRLVGYNLVVEDTTAQTNVCDGIEQSQPLLAALAPAAVENGGCGPSQAQLRAAAQSASAPAAVNGGAPVSWTVAISNTTVFSNGEDGIDIGAVDLVTVTSVSALSNTVNGIRLYYTEQLFGLRPAGFGFPTMTAVVADSYVTGNEVGIELNDSLPLYPAGGPGPEVPGITAVVNGNVVCANTVAGLASTGNVSHTFDATNTYWGSFTGPLHVLKNPTGTGDPVADAANPIVFDANGDVLIAPWVDRGQSAIFPAAGVVGQPQDVSIFFPAGVLPGLVQGPGDPNGGPLFQIATSNGALATAFGSGAAAPAAIGPGGALTATLTPSAVGTASITVTGPCGLTYITSFPVIAPSIGVVKSVGTDPNACATPGPITVPISSTIYYCLNVTNTGNVTLTNHLVTDAQLGIINVPVTYTLAPGASVPITRSAVPGLGPILMTRSITNVAAITSTAVFTEIGGVILEPNLTVAVESAGAVRVTAQPTGLDPGEEPAADKRLYLPALGR